jgi:muramidase (phage lysozyme)
MDALSPIAASLKQWIFDLPGMVSDALKGMWEDFKKNFISYPGGDFGGGGGIIRTSFGGGGGFADHPALRGVGGGHPSLGSLGGGTGGSSKPIGNTAVWAGLSPYARGLLDAISGPESGGSYNMLFGGGHFSSYSSHPWAGRSAPGGHSDAGRYQFLASTWRRAASALGLHDFGPESQDKAAWWLAVHDYRAHTGHDLESDMRSEHFDPAGLSSTWVSMAKRTNSWMKRFYEPNVGRACQHPVTPYRHHDQPLIIRCTWTACPSSEYLGQKAAGFSGGRGSSDG